MGPLNGSPGSPVDPGTKPFEGEVSMGQIADDDGKPFWWIKFDAPGDKRAYILPLEVAEIVERGAGTIARAGKLSLTPARRLIV